MSYDGRLLRLAQERYEADRSIREAEQAARREALEEFGIQLGPMYRLGQLDGLPEEYGLPVVFLCTDYAGDPVCDGKEMEGAAFLSMEDIGHTATFPPFGLSLQLLESVLAGGDAP